MDKRQIASVTNGRIRAVVNFRGVMVFYRDGKPFLQEYFREYDGTLSRESRCLKIVNPERKGIIGGRELNLNVKFESNDGERLYGMGQYQQPYLDLKGCVLELAQRNSQISVPFLVSSLGYGMLWNNPAVGQAAFGKNYTEWTARSTRQMDYWLTVADAPRGILENYTAVTGRAPMFPEDRMGLWQCKLRYRTQEEVLSVARQYQKEGIQIDQIVIDFFHWTVQGDWKFDTTYWPDPKAMVEELHAMGIKVFNYQGGGVHMALRGQAQRAFLGDDGQGAADPDGARGGPDLRLSGRLCGNRRVQPGGQAVCVGGLQAELLRPGDRRFLAGQFRAGLRGV